MEPPWTGPNASTRSSCCCAAAAASASTALLDELDVSPATLKRDLQYLRDRLARPSSTTAFDNGYRFEASRRAQRATRHELPGLWFSENEIHALLTMHQLIAGLDDDGVLARHLQPMMDKLQGMLGADDERGARADAPRQGDRHRAAARAAAGTSSCSAARWCSASACGCATSSAATAATSEREVSPQRLVNYRNTWYLDAWCHASDGLRRFALDAMRDAAAARRSAPGTWRVQANSRPSSTPATASTAAATPR